MVRRFNQNELERVTAMKEAKVAPTEKAPMSTVLFESEKLENNLGEEGNAGIVVFCISDVVATVESVATTESSGDCLRRVGGEASVPVEFCESGRVLLALVVEFKV